MFIKLWKAYIKRLDKIFLGQAIKKVADEKANNPEEAKRYIAYAWAMHKIADPNYDDNDFTDEEKQAVIDMVKGE